MLFPITYWYGIRKEFLSKERLIEARDAGFTHIECEYDAETNKQVLVWAEELGLKVNLGDRRMELALAQKPSWEDALRGMMEEYRLYPALCRYFVKDEPTNDWFEVLGKIADVMRETDPTHPPYINLFPSCVYPGTYGEHLDGYLDAVKPELLSFDHYIFKKRPVTLSELDPDKPFYEAPVSSACRSADHTEDVLYEAFDDTEYYYNMEIARQKAMERGIDWMMVILLSEHWHYRYLTEAELRLEVMAALAYGASAISYFTYWTPTVTGEPWTYHHGIIEANGERSERYFQVKRLNAEIQAHHLAISGDRVERILQIGEETDPMTLPYEGDLFTAPKQARLLVSQISGGKWMLVNKDHRAPVTVQLHTEGKTVLRYDRERAVWDRMPNAAVLPLALNAGDGLLIQLI